MEPPRDASPVARGPGAFRRACPDCEDSRTKLQRAVVVIEALKARVAELETSAARRGAIGGRQRVGETLDEKVLSELERKDQEVRTMREAVIELSAQIAQKEALLLDCQERLAEAATRPQASTGDLRNGRAPPVPPVERHYPGGWRPPGANVTASSMSEPAFAVPQKMTRPQILTAKEFAAGFKKTLAFQPCVIKQNGGSSDEASATRSSRERRSGGDVEDSADSLQALWSQWVARATASSHCGLLHLGALSASAKRLFESLGLPQEEGTLKLATVDCGPAPSLRVFARQSDQTAAIEISESQSRLEANDGECCFLIFGFGGRMRSPPSDRPDFVVNCNLIRSTAAPYDQFQKWRDAFARCRLLESVDAGRRSQKPEKPSRRPSSKKMQSNADSLVREVLRKCSDFDKAQHYLNWFHQNMGKPDAAGRVLSLEEVTEAQLRVMQFFEEGGGKRDSSSSDASSSSSYKPRRGRPRKSKEDLKKAKSKKDLKRKGTGGEELEGALFGSDSEALSGEESVDAEEEANFSAAVLADLGDVNDEPQAMEDGYPVQHWEDCAREVLPGYEGFNRRATAVMIKSEVGQGQLQVTFDEQAACPPLQPHQEEKF
ncbi:hypothetical protein AK812_SmicGene28533 [Symbiodinium microadriaticum]|uniref:Uncharacterized protein n=1 Tax=Symbiodinium microadriaticum TaxID=2951 RepID=A0A1Q9D442_SYMMI|nr:hypothetical protein AK812_SmicGene28533 [Symbiodinium microadriaticum]